MEIENFNEILDDTKNRLQKIFRVKDPNNNNSIQLLSNQALNKGLKSTSQHLYQLVTFDLVLKLVEEIPDRFIISKITASFQMATNTVIT